MASDIQIGIIVRARDEASAALSRLKDNFEGLQKRMKPATDASKAFAVGIAGAATAAAAFGYKAVQAAAESQAAMAKVNTILKTLNGSFEDNAQAVDLASAAAARLGFDDEEAALSVAKLAQHTNDMTSAVQLNTLAMDLARYKSIELEQASKIVSLAYEGNIAALRQYGVDIKNVTDPMGALNELQKQVSGQADTFSKTFSGQMQVLNVAWGNFLEEVGTKVLPILTELLIKFTDFATTTLPKVIEKIDEVTGWLMEHKIVLYLVAGAITGGLVPAILFSLIPAMISIATTAAAGAVALAPWVLGGTLIAGLVAGIVWLVKNWDTAKEKIVGAWRWIRENIEPWVMLFLGPAGILVRWTVDAIQHVIAHWGEYSKGVVEVFNKIKDFFVRHWEDLKGVFSIGVSALMPVLQPLISIFNLINAGIDKINSMGGVSGVWDKAVGGLKSIHEKVKANYTPMAAGGVVTRPTFAQIGEAGPEAVIPLARMGNMGGNMTINITGNYIKDGLDMRELARQVGEEIARVVKFQVRV